MPPEPPAALTYEEAKRDCDDIVNRTVRTQLDWHKNRRRWPRIAHRTTGILVILLSLLLPVLATNVAAGDSLAREIITPVSLAVTALTALSGFFRWDITWRGRIETSLRLQGLIGQWEFRVSKARIEPDPVRAVFEATDQLVTEALAVVGEETNRFFEHVRPPATLGTPHEPTQ